MEAFSADRIVVVLLQHLHDLRLVWPLIVFAGFAVFYLGETLRWNHLASFGCLVAAAFFMFRE
jgi:uncharacterized protein (DUF486 family)